MTNPGIAYQVGSRTATIIIAAANSAPWDKGAADVVCPGSHDDVAINAAIASLSNGGTARLMVGQYYLSNPILIDQDWITLQGEGKTHWCRYVGAYPTHNTPGSPGGAQLIQTVSGYDGISIGSTTANMHGDTRHKGIAIRDLYLLGQNYNGTGIYDAGTTDISEIRNVQIQGFANGIDVAWDTPQIVGNNIQDNSGFGIKANFVYGSITDNICFDLGSYGIILASMGTNCFGNTIGDIAANDGISISGSRCTVSGNTINGIPAGHGISLLSSASRNAITGNMISLTGHSTPNSSNNTAYDGICLGKDSTACNFNAITGNVIDNPSMISSTGYAIAMLGSSTANAVVGNVITGSQWNGGGANTNVSQGTGNTFASNAGQQ